MVLFNSNGKLKKYKDVEEIFREFVESRRAVYQKRIDYSKSLNEARKQRCEQQQLLYQLFSINPTLFQDKKGHDLMDFLIANRFKADPVRILELNSQQTMSVAQEEMLFEDIELNNAVGEVIILNICLIL